MRYYRPTITKLNQQRHQFLFHQNEAELDQLVMDRMRRSLISMDVQSIGMLKSLFEKKMMMKDIILKRIK